MFTFYTAPKRRTCLKNRYMLCKYNNRGGVFSKHFRIFFQVILRFFIFSRLSRILDALYFENQNKFCIFDAIYLD